MRIRPISLSSLVVASELLLVAILLLGAAYVVREVGNTRDRVVAAELAEARDEMGSTLLRLQIRMQCVSEEVADWEEIRSQYGEPVYYAYWKENRALKSLRVPHLLDLELYFPDGRPLNGRVPSGMPKSQEELPQQTLVKMVEGRPVILERVDIRAQRLGELVGSAVLSLDFHQQLLEEGFFSRIDEASIQLNLAEGEQVALASMSPHIQYELHASEALEEITRTLWSSLGWGLALLLLLALLSSVGFHLFLVKPARHLGGLVRNMRSGVPMMQSDSAHTSVLVKELEDVRIALMRYHSGMEDARSALGDKNRELETLAYQDALTGVLNRRAFDRDWNAMLNAPGRYPEVACLLFDCNGFKAINDTYGHDVGDAVLTQVANVLCQALGEQCKLYRLGGDEFTSVITGQPLAGVEVQAEKCLEAVRAASFVEFGLREPVRVTVGIAHSANDKSGAMQNLRRDADIAMYQAKRPGSKGIAVYRGSGEQGLVSSPVNAAVFAALDQPQNLNLVFEPVVNLDTDDVLFYECLSRLRHGGSELSPADFMPVIHLKHLEIEFDLAVIRRLSTMVFHHEVPASAISINLFGPSVTDERVIGAILELAAVMRPYDLFVEVTETMLVTQMEQASRTLQLFRSSGCKVALDDFGSGYSSLGYLAEMPVDLIKFDMEIVRELHKGGSQSEILSGIAKILRSNGYLLVAEGVEDQTQCKLLRQLGFSYGQGYSFTRVPEGETLAQG